MKFGWCRNHVLPSSPQTKFIRLRRRRRSLLHAEELLAICKNILCQLTTMRYSFYFLCVTIFSISGIGFLKFILNKTTTKRIFRKVLRVVPTYSEIKKKECHYETSLQRTNNKEQQRGTTRTLVLNWRSCQQKHQF